MRTYTHALLTLATARHLNLCSPVWATAGSILPDLPASLGAAWLWARRGFFDREQFRQQVCAKSAFRVPDTAFHSAVPVAALALYVLSGAGGHSMNRPLTALLLGWAGHVAADTLTHGEDARPPLWPLSGWRFGSPVSYWEERRRARLFTLGEHAAVLAAACYLLAAAGR